MITNYFTLKFASTNMLFRCGHQTWCWTNANVFSVVCIGQQYSIFLYNVLSFVGAPLIRHMA